MDMIKGGEGGEGGEGVVSRFIRKRSLLSDVVDCDEMPENLAAVNCSACPGRKHDGTNCVLRKYITCCIFFPDHNLFLHYKTFDGLHDFDFKGHTWDDLL